MKIIKILFRITLSILICFIAWNGPMCLFANAEINNQAAVSSSKDNNSPSYASNKFIVKFKGEGSYAVKGCVDCLLNEKKTLQRALADESNSLDILNEKFKIKKAQKLFSPQHSLFVQKSVTAQKRNANIPDLTNIYLLEAPQGTNIEEIVDQYSQDPHVEYAHPDYLVTTQLAVNDPYFQDQWGLEKIEAQRGWDYAQGEDIVVAVVDSGIDYTHEDLAGNLWFNNDDPLGDVPDQCDRVAYPEIDLADDDCNGYVDDYRGYDFTECEQYSDEGCDLSKEADNDPMDGYYHGTHVAGIIAAVGDNGVGIAGVSLKSKLMPVKGLNDQGYGLISELAEGIVYAAMNGAHVINNSWGCTRGCPSRPIIEDAVRFAHALGKVIVFAAGNSSGDVSYFSPQNMQETITVAALDVNDERSLYSNFGDLIDVAAPGDDIFSTVLQDEGYRRVSGTSMAAPHVSGLVALILSQNPSLSNEEVRSIIRVTSEDVKDPGFDKFSGYGRINAFHALRLDTIVRSEIQSPGDLSIVNKDEVSVDIIGSADGPTFDHYQLSVKKDLGQEEWEPLGEPGLFPVSESVINAWDVEDLDSGLYHIQLETFSTDDYALTDQVSVILSENHPILPITDDSSVQNEVAIDGNKIIWADRRLDSFNLFLYDLQTKEERQITNTLDNDHGPDISGNIIAFKRADFFVGGKAVDNIVLYNLETDEETVIITSNQNTYNGYPEISGNHVVWRMLDRSDSTIYKIMHYDIQTEELSELVLMEFFSSLAVDGDYVVYSGKLPEQQDVSVGFYNLLTGESQEIGQGTMKAFSDGKVFIALSSIDPSVDSQLYIYDILTGEKSVIASNYKGARFAAIDGDVVVWEKLITNDVSEIVYYNLKTKIERQLYVSSSLKRDIGISGNTVVWTNIKKDGEIQQWDIYSAGIVGPFLKPLEDKVAYVGKNLSFEVKAKSYSGQDISLSAQFPDGQEEAMSFVDHGNGVGTFSWTPDFSNEGQPYPVKFKAVNSLNPQELDQKVVNVEVRKADYFLGQVVDFETGNPIVGAQMTLKGRRATDGERLSLSSLSDKDGYFAFFNLSDPEDFYFLKGRSQRRSQKYRFYADRAGDNGSELTSRITDISSFLRVVGIPLKSTGRNEAEPGEFTIAGYVLSKDGSLGLADAEVRIKEVRGNKQRLTVRTDAQGYFLFENLSNGEYAISVRFGSYRVKLTNNIIIDNSDAQVDILNTR